MLRVSQNHDSIARSSPEVFVGKDVHIAGESHCNFCVVSRDMQGGSKSMRRTASISHQDYCAAMQEDATQQEALIPLGKSRPCSLKQRVGRDGGLAFRADFPSLTIIPSLQVLGMLESTPVKIAQVPGVRHKHWGSGGRANQLDYYKFHGPGH